MNLGRGWVWVGRSFLGLQASSVLQDIGEDQSFAKFFSKLGGVYDFPFREISREIR